MSDGDGSRKLLYDPHIFICTEENTCKPGTACCGASGTAELLAHMKMATKQRGIKNIRVNRSRCLERCENGPVMVLYPEGVWYTFRTKEDIDEIVEDHLVKGGRATRLMVDAPDQARVAGTKA